MSIVVGLLRSEVRVADGPAAPSSTVTTAFQEPLPGNDEIRRGDLEAARREIALHLQENPDDSQARYLLALTHEREADWEGALKAYLEILDDDPRDFEAHFRIGSLQRRQNELEAAAVSFDRSLQLNSDFTAARVALAEVRAELGEPDRAIELYFEVIEMRPMGVHLDDVRLALARLLLEVDQPENAQIQLNRALVENPDNQAARELLNTLETGPATTTTTGPTTTSTS